MKTHRNNFRASILGLLGVGLTLCLSFCDAPQPEPLCADEMQDGEESDVDCGGPMCQWCSIGKRCFANADCLTDVCTNGICAASDTYPSCSDGMLNGVETDVDCGGLCPTRCAPGAKCALGTDCATGACVSGTCHTATCSDGSMNGPETDIDCGGGCAPCGVGKACKLASDCAPWLCTNNRCGLGSGSDSALSVAAGMVQTINQLASPATGGKGATSLSVQSASGMAKGQMLLIHQTQGSGAGNSEVNQIVDLSGTTLTLQNPLANSYATGAQAIVIPQYTSVTINGAATLTAPAWDGTKGGILIFQASGAVTIDGTVTMRGKGFRGAGASGVCFPGAPGCLLNHGRNGESDAGAFNFSTMNVNGRGNNNGGGGGGGTRGQDCAAGGGGSYGSSGTAGADGTLGMCIVNSLHGGGLAGSVLGTPDLTAGIFLGPAGGEGGPDESGAYPGFGGSGGGIIAIFGGSLSVNAASGTIDAGGADGGSGSATGPCGGSGTGMGNGGGGAGGAIRILTGGSATLATGRVTALGGSGGATGSCSGYAGGSGGMGRIQVRAGGNISGSTSPVAYQL